MTRALQAEISFLKIKSIVHATAPAGATLVLGLCSPEKTAGKGNTAMEVGKGAAGNKAKKSEKSSEKLTEADEGAHPVKSLRGQRELEGAFAVLSAHKSFKGKADSMVSLLHHSRGLENLGPYENLVGFGVGHAKDCLPQNVLSWGGKIAHELRREKATDADIFIDSLYNPASAADAEDAPKDFAGRALRIGIMAREEFLEKLALGIYLGLYTFDRYKTGAQKKEKYRPKIRFLSQSLDGRRAAEILERAQILAEAAYLTRDLQTTPGGDMQPAEIARQAQQAGREAGFSVTVWDEKKLKTEGMNGILSVGQGSDAPPRFIIMEHSPGGAAAKKNLPTLVFVGKGISFDSGGISIKPAAGMDEMKMDMSGSAAVIGTLYALAKLGAPVHAYGLVASAENMVSGKAIRPGDIYTAYDGTTVEVLNTDAEGRLVLGDALAYAHTLNPDCVIDIATLTGAVIMALGAISTGLMGNNGKLLEGFKAASEKTGERVWELPLYPEYAEDLKSKVSDLRNIGMEKGAGSQKAGSFLNFFVKNGYPWIHLDVAGTADTPKPQGAHCPPDVGTAVPMRSLVEFALGFKQYFGGSKK